MVKVTFKQTNRKRMVKGLRFMVDQNPLLRFGIKKPYEETNFLNTASGNGYVKILLY
jgi:hypothetical protein